MTALLNVRQTCQWLGCSRATLYRIVARGELQRLYVGARPRFRVSALEDYIAGKQNGVDERSRETSEGVDVLQLDPDELDPETYVRTWGYLKCEEAMVAYLDERVRVPKERERLMLLWRDFWN